MVFKQGCVLLALLMVCFPATLLSNKTDLFERDGIKENRHLSVNQREVERVRALDDFVERAVYIMKRDIYQQCHGNPALIGPAMASYYRELWDFISRRLEEDEFDFLE